jgi:hypothetical protein
MHTAVAPEGTGSKSVRHLPLAQFEAMTAEVNVARNLRNCCVTSSTQLNIIQRGSTSAVHAAGIVQLSHTQDNRKGAAKSEISQGTRYPVVSHGFYGSPKSRRMLREMLRLC